MPERATNPAGMILLVEDDADIRTALREMLDDEGYAVDTVSDGAEALAYLRRLTPPAMILLDWRMPVMSGDAFLRALRADPALARIPVVVLSADRGEVATALSLGVDLFIEKPVDVERLLNAVAQFTSPTRGR